MGKGRASSSHRETEVHHKEGPRRQRWPRVPLPCSVCVVLPGLGPRKVAPLLLSQGPHTSGLILPTRAQISRRPHILPPLAPPWLPGGDTGLKVAFYFFSVRNAQTIQCQEERALLPIGHWQNPQGALPTSQRQQRKGKQPGLWGLEQEGDLFVND